MKIIKLQVYEFSELPSHVQECERVNIRTTYESHPQLFSGQTLEEALNEVNDYYYDKNYMPISIKRHEIDEFQNK